MVSSTAKRVVAYRFDRQPVEGFVSPSAFLLQHGAEILSTGGAVHVIPFGELKAICFSSEAARPDLFTSQNVFGRRPKLPGLWVRFVLRDGDQIDGVLSHNLPDWPPQGYFLVPPHSSSARQRVFLPREALRRTELQGVIGTITGKGKVKKPPEDQLEMFD